VPIKDLLFLINPIRHIKQKIINNKINGKGNIFKFKIKVMKSFYIIYIHYFVV